MLQQCGLVGSHTAYRCKLRLGVDGTASAGNKMTALGRLMLVRAWSSAKQRASYLQFGLGMLFVPETHRVYTGALLENQSDLLKRLLSEKMLVI